MIFTPGLQFRKRNWHRGAEVTYTVVRVAGCDVWAEQGDSGRRILFFDVTLRRYLKEGKAVLC